MYFPGDPIIRFHYALIRPNQPRLRTRAAATAFWPGAKPTFHSTVVGLGGRASDATLVVVGSRFAKSLVTETASRSDVELVDLERLYFGS